MPLTSYPPLSSIPSRLFLSREPTTESRCAPPRCAPPSPSPNHWAPFTTPFDNSPVPFSLLCPTSFCCVPTPPPLLCGALVAPPPFRAPPARANALGCCKASRGRGQRHEGGGRMDKPPPPCLSPPPSFSPLPPPVDMKPSGAGRRASPPPPAGTICATHWLAPSINTIPPPSAPPPPHRRFAPLCGALLARPLLSPLRRSGREGGRARGGSNAKASRPLSPLRLRRALNNIQQRHHQKTKPPTTAHYQNKTLGFASLSPPFSLLTSLFRSLFLGPFSYPFVSVVLGIALIARQRWRAQPLDAAAAGCADATTHPLSASLPPVSPPNLPLFFCLRCSMLSETLCEFKKSKGLVGWGGRHQRGKGQPSKEHKLPTESRRRQGRGRREEGGGDTTDCAPEQPSTGYGDGGGRRDASADSSSRAPPPRARRPAHPDGRGPRARRATAVTRASRTPPARARRRPPCGRRAPRRRAPPRARCSRGFGR